ncbi:hypothetical protein Q3C19_17455 [Bacteroides sp. ET489]|uniref:hypothetical protein n=1 Tax=Bacteroides sp. ET489 TaxID=3057126 RepID=UPI00267366D1|nr:hypothetical protein [Bacteroides sp. ET489]MDO3392242.1 hypothetical protein [Bacteroides sp. ET489]
MKSKYLFLAMAAATMVACTNEDFTQEASSVGHDGLGELVKAPMLGVSIEADANTKAFEGTGFLWRPTTVNGKVTSTENIGLCWTGVGTPEYGGPTDVTGDKVYTNIKFDHVGWLYSGEKTPKLHCGVLENGEYHNWNEDLTPVAQWNDTRWEPMKAGQSFDYATGMFKSDNGTIYAGEYIVYFPYNNSFWNAPVTAEQNRILTLDIKADETLTTSYTVADPSQLMSENSFNVGYVAAINGGDEACAFSTKMLTSGINFKLNGDADIKEIVLLSKGEKAFITKMALSAKKIKENIANGTLTTDVYMTSYQGNEAASTLVVKTHDEKGNCLNILPYFGTTTFYVPFLPNTFQDMRVLIVDKDGRVAEINIPSLDNITFEANKPKNLTLNFIGNQVKYNDTVIATFENVNYAYDEESFIDAFTKARTNANDEKVAPRTVQLLDNITLTKQVQDQYYKTSTHPVMINSDEDLNGEKNLLTLGGIENGNVNYMFRNVEFDANIENEPQGCCNKGKASLTLIDVTTAEGTELNLYGTKLNLYSQNVVFNGDVYSKFEPTDEEGELHPDRVPEIELINNNSNKVVARGTFLNEGKMNIALKTKFSLEGGQLTNGSADADYRASITVNGNGNVGEDGVLLMSEGATFTNHGDIYNKGNIDNNSAEGTFTNEDGATFTDYVGSTLSGYRIENKGNAEFICEVNSLIRYNNAIDLNGIRPTTTLRFVYGDNANIGNGDFIKEYTLQPNKDNGIYVPYNESKLMKFESAIDATTSNKANTLRINAATNQDNEVIATTIGSFTIKSGRVDLYHAGLTIDGNYTVDGGHHTYFGENLTVTGDVVFKNVIANASNNELTGAVNLREDKILTVGKDIIVNKVTTLTFKNGSQVIAKNMTVDKAQKVTFEKNNVTKLGKYGFEGVLTNNGQITIVNAVSGSDVAAKVWCNQRLGNGTYVNNSYPQYWSK